MQHKCPNLYKSVIKTDATAFICKQKLKTDFWEYFVKNRLIVIFQGNFRAYMLAKNTYLVKIWPK